MNDSNEKKERPTSVGSSEWLGHWFITEESIIELVGLLSANCFPVVCIALDAHKNSQRQKPLCFPLSVMDQASPLRPLFRLAELQMALVRRNGAGTFPIWLRWSYWTLCKWSAYVVGLTTKLTDRRAKYRNRWQTTAPRKTNDI